MKLCSSLNVKFPPQVHQYNVQLSVGNPVWVDELVVTMAMHMLVRCPTPFERSHLLRLLSEAQFGQDFNCNATGECMCVNYCYLCVAIQYLVEPQLVSSF